MPRSFLVCRRPSPSGPADSDHINITRQCARADVADLTPSRDRPISVQGTSLSGLKSTTCHDAIALDATPAPAENETSSIDFRHLTTSAAFFGWSSYASDDDGEFRNGDDFQVALYNTDGVLLPTFTDDNEFRRSSTTSTDDSQSDETTILDLSPRSNASSTSSTPLHSASCEGQGHLKPLHLSPLSPGSTADGMVNVSGLFNRNSFTSSALALLHQSAKSVSGDSTGCVSPSTMSASNCSELTPATSDASSDDVWQSSSPTIDLRKHLTGSADDVTSVTAGLNLVGRGQTDRVSKPPSGSLSSSLQLTDGRYRRRRAAALARRGSEGGNSRRPATSDRESDDVTATRYACDECDRRYATSSNLSRHKQTHRSVDGEFARQCPHCRKVYVSMPALAMHLLTHDLKYRCSACDKAFSRPWLLRGHERSHTGERPFACAQCGKAFADRSNLRAHVQTHSSAKRFSCPRCGKTFALKSYLTKHCELACGQEQ